MRNRPNRSTTDEKQGLVRGEDDEDNFMNASRSITRKKKDADDSEKRVAKSMFPTSSPSQDATAKVFALETDSMIRFQRPPSLRFVLEVSTAHLATSNLVSGTRKRSTS